MVGPTTNHRLERAGDIQRLEAAKLHLIERQEDLRALRRMGSGDAYLAYATLKLYKALDRVWMLQCMVNGVFE